MAVMSNSGWLLLPVGLGLIYLAGVIAALDGAMRAVRERFLPPWVVGLAVFLLVAALGHQLLDGGVFLAIPVGVIAGAVYGVRRRRHETTAA